MPEHRAAIERLRKLLAETGATLDDLRDFVAFDDEHARRNHVCQEKWHEILIICWKSGQRSPIHHHARSTCGLQVLAVWRGGILGHPVPDRATLHRFILPRSTFNCARPLS